ncbi:MAG: hypothetical protein JW820_01435, partial [Spirochaetales bacterium]|nr:hypothetical protein [Spirochaetales bacterium]
EDGGYAVVRVNGVESNAHPLSRWQMDLDVSGTVPSGIGPDIVLALDASWRAEIVDERGLVTSDPIPIAGQAGTMFGLGSTCDYQFSGTFEDSRYIYEYPEGANQGTMPVCLDGAQMFFGTVVLKPDQGTASFQIVLAREAFVLKTDKQNPEAGQQADQIQVTVGLIFEAGMDADGNITAGEQALPYQFSWPAIAPEFPPLPETAR